MKVPLYYFHPWLRKEYEINLKTLKVDGLIRNQIKGSRYAKTISNLMSQKLISNPG